MQFPSLPPSFARYVLGAHTWRIAVYLLAGGVAWLIDVTTFALILPQFGTIWAQLSARIIGAIIAFFGHKFFAFQDFDSRPSTFAQQAGRYAVLWVISFAIGTWALVGLIDRAQCNPVLSKLIVDPAITLFNYLVLKSVIFQSRITKGVHE